MFPINPCSHWGRADPLPGPGSPSAPPESDRTRATGSLGDTPPPVGGTAASRATGSSRVTDTI